MRSRNIRERKPPLIHQRPHLTRIHQPRSLPEDLPVMRTSKPRYIEIHHLSPLHIRMSRNSSIDITTAPRLLCIVKCFNFAS